MRVAGLTAGDDTSHKGCYCKFTVPTEYPSVHTARMRPEKAIEPVVTAPRVGERSQMGEGQRDCRHCCAWAFGPIQMCRQGGG